MTRPHAIGLYAYRHKHTRIVEILIWFRTYITQTISFHVIYSRQLTTSCTEFEIFFSDFRFILGISAFSVILVMLTCCCKQWFDGKL